MIDIAVLEKIYNDEFEKQLPHHKVETSHGLALLAVYDYGYGVAYLRYNSDAEGYT